MNLVLRPASEMKDSGVEWIGKTPIEWRITKISNEYEVQLGKMLGSKELKGAELKDYLRAANVFWGKFDLEEVKQMYILPSEKEAFSIRSGDLLVCEGGDVGRAAIWKGEIEDCYIQNSLHRIRPRSNNATNRYLYYILYAASSRGEMEAVSSKATIAHYTLIKVKRTKIPIPLGEVQEKIARYLDAETSKIQQLIATKTKQIQLLQEYEKSLIHHAVTKGLDPKAKMKDSRVEWIGKMPNNWTTQRFKYMCDYKKGKAPAVFLDAASTNTLPYLEMEYLREQSEPKYTTLSDNSVTVNDGDILLLWDGSKAGEFITGKKGILSSTMARISEKKKKHLLRYIVKSFEPVLVDLTNGMGIPHVRSEVLMNIRVPVIPDNEDKQIAAYLDSETSKIYRVINTIETQITKLEEYRKSLIYEVVTGKVRVS